MKKLTILLVLTACISCKKDRVCECATETPQGIYVTTTTLFDVKKSEARNNCIGSQTTLATSTSTTTGNKTTCKLY